MSYIWLDGAIWPSCIHNLFNINGVNAEKRKTLEENYRVAEFTREYDLPAVPQRLTLDVSADCFFQLYVNGELTGVGPAAAGGDFLEPGPAPRHYLNRYEISTDSTRLSLRALVRLMPDVLTDYSRGRGGFFAHIECAYPDGKTDTFDTDESWLSRPCPAYVFYTRYDGARPLPHKAPSAAVPDIWQDTPAPIPMLSLNRIALPDAQITLAPGETLQKELELDRIYGVYPRLSADGACEITLEMRELKTQGASRETIVFDGKDEYMSFHMHSAGTVTVTAKNTGKAPVNINADFIAPWYPVTAAGSLETSDAGFNKVYDVCRHTLKICRQTLHLDSTSHQEPLACTGDYYIETLMNLYCFGDMRLSAFDVRRTADWLYAHDGRMFHTTYSLIWVLMLRDVFMFTGDQALLRQCRPALDRLLARFDSYRGEEGLIENPPDFMFVDWTVIDGFSMHHPPKCLGQTVLNAYWYGALNAAKEIYQRLSDDTAADRVSVSALKLKAEFNRTFWDEGRQMYFDGKGDAHGDGSTFCPVNVNRRYFSRYSNILAVCFGLLEGAPAAELMERVFSDDTLQDIQPYFAHWALCALDRCGLFGSLGLKLLSRWVPVVEACDKGLAEGWIAPQPDYSFDHSHAWGGTFAYRLPQALTGMEIVSPGMDELVFRPRLYGLEYARVRIPAPGGMIEVSLKQGAAPVVTAPAGIGITVINEGL